MSYYLLLSLRGYEEIPWENMAPKGRCWSHTTTLEKRPDMVSQAFTNKRYEPAACEWQVRVNYTACEWQVRVNFAACGWQVRVKFAACE